VDQSNGTGVNLKNTAEWIGTLILHFLVAMFAGSFFGYLLGALSASLILLFTGFRVASLGPITVYTPLVWGWALLLGFVVNRKIRTQSLAGLVPWRFSAWL